MFKSGLDRLLRGRVALGVLHLLDHDDQAAEVLRA